MTWKRVATAVVLIPAVVALVLRTQTAWVALAVAGLTLMALFEFFALGDAIGHRAYRFWTATCACLLVFAQYLGAMEYAQSLGSGLSLHKVIGRFAIPGPSVADVLFVFLIGVSVLTLATRRPLVE